MGPHLQFDPAVQDVSSSGQRWVTPMRVREACVEDNKRALLWFEATWVIQQLSLTPLCNVV